MPGYVERLEDRTFIGGGNVLFSLDTLKKGYRIRKLDLYFDLSGTKDAADTLAGDVFPRIVQSVRLGNFVNVSGMDLHRLGRIVHGRQVMAPTDIAAGAAVFDMEFHLEIPFRDPRQSGSDDGSLPTECLLGRALEVTFAASTLFAGAGPITVTAGTVRCQAELVHDTNVPQLNRLYFIDPASQTVQLDPGIYKECFIHEAAGTTITAAEISAMDLEVDGSTVMNNTLHEQVIEWFNTSAVGDSAADLAVGAAAFMPIIWQDQSGKSHLTKQPAIEKKGKLQLSGTMTSPHIVVWKALLKDDAVIAQVAVETGAPLNAVKYEAAVASKSSVKAPENGNDKKARLIRAALPGKMRLAGRA